MCREAVICGSLDKGERVTSAALVAECALLAKNGNMERGKNALAGCPRVEITMVSLQIPILTVVALHATVSISSLLAKLSARIGLGQSIGWIRGYSPGKQQRRAKGIPLRPEPIGEQRNLLSSLSAMHDRCYRPYKSPGHPCPLLPSILRCRLYELLMKPRLRAFSTEIYMGKSQKRSSLPKAHMSSWMTEDSK